MTFCCSINQLKETEPEQHEAVGPDIRIAQETAAGFAGIRRSIHGGLVTRGYVQRRASLSRRRARRENEETTLRRSVMWKETFERPPTRNDIAVYILSTNIERDRYVDDDLAKWSPKLPSSFIDGRAFSLHRMDERTKSFATILTSMREVLSCLSPRYTLHFFPVYSTNGSFPSGSAISYARRTRQYNPTVRRRVPVHVSFISTRYYLSETSFDVRRSSLSQKLVAPAITPFDNIL